MVKDDGRRGFYLVGPFPLYCFDMPLVRRAHEQAALDATRAGVSLIRLTCDYAFAQNQGRTQEGGLISCPVFMSEVTRASTEGLAASGRIAVILKHLGPYQYTAGPDYTALPIERTEFLETVLPRYAGGFEAGAHGVMMSFVALNGVPAHADPFLRDLVKAHAIPAPSSSRTTTGSTNFTAGSATRPARRRRRCGGSATAASISTYARSSSSATCRNWWRKGASTRRSFSFGRPRCCTARARGPSGRPDEGHGPRPKAALLAGPTTAYRDLARASVVLLRPTRP
jgi:hypothetical protein